MKGRKKQVEEVKVGKCETAKKVLEEKNLVSASSICNPIMPVLDYKR